VLLTKLLAKLPDETIIAAAGFYGAYSLTRQRLLERVGEIVGGFSPGAGLQLYLTGKLQGACSAGGCDTASCACCARYCLLLPASAGHSGLAANMGAMCMCHAIYFLSLAGHSLGGALALLAAFDLQRLHPQATATVYTFGAPRVRDRWSAADPFSPSTAVHLFCCWRPCLAVPLSVPDLHSCIDHALPA
jgi:hypothetical protein